MLFDYAIDLLEFLRKDRKKSLIVAVLFFGLVATLLGVVGQFVILVLSALSLVVAFFVGEFMIRNVGIELVTFTTVFVGFLYGPATGFLFGMVLLIIHSILSRMLGPYVIYCIPMMGIVGFLSGYAGAGGWFGGDFVLIGIVLSLIYNLVTGTLGTIFGGNLFKELLWNGTNFMMNLILFWKIAPIVLAVLV
jgi:hypothetical protein